MDRFGVIQKIEIVSHSTFDFGLDNSENDFHMSHISSA